MTMKLETMIRRRNKLLDKLNKSQSHYGGNIAVPSSLRLQWDDWRFRIAHAIAASPEAQALERLRQRCGI